jgi:DnaK suppressor protein
VTPREEARLRTALADRRAEIEAELARVVARQSDPSLNLGFGKRIGEGTTEAVERYNRTAAAGPLAATMTEIDRAFEKLDEGTYGRCDDGGEEIGAERLEAVPWATTCVRCRARRARTS